MHRLEAQNLIIALLERLIEDKAPQLDGTRGAVEVLLYALRDKGGNGLVVAKRSLSFTERERASSLIKDLVIDAPAGSHTFAHKSYNIMISDEEPSEPSYVSEVIKKIRHGKGE